MTAVFFNPAPTHRRDSRASPIPKGSQRSSRSKRHHRSAINKLTDPGGIAAAFKPRETLPGYAPANWAQLAELHVGWKH